MTLVTSVSIPVDARAPGGATNVSLVGERDALVVDPGADDPAVFDAIADRGTDVGHVAVTHAHPDHVGGVAALADHTGATVWARRGYADRFAAAAGVDPDHTFVEGTQIPTGAGPVTVLDTPGHAPDHVAFVVRGPSADAAPSMTANPDVDTDRHAAVLCGDLAVAKGSVAVGAPEGEMRAYLVSLRRLRARTPAVLYPGHGPRIDEPRAVLDRLLRHRLDRERRVLAAVAEGARDPDAVTEAAYDKDLSGVREMARATVVAHVEKLAAEGRVRWDPDRERIQPA